VALWNKTMSELYEIGRMYQRRQRALLEYIKELKTEAQAEVAHKSSPVTSMRDDEEIRTLGREKLEIIRRILATMGIQ
jgi:hypothetical protein